MYETILYEKKGSLVTITLNRPETSNAFEMNSFLEIKEALEKAGDDTEIRVIILTGIGKNFSAGGDITEFKKYLDQGTGLGEEAVLATGAMARAVKKVRKPVIAMINGAAAGAGASLALACDFRVMEEESRLAMSFINMGFVGDTLGQYLLNRMIGTARTTELMATGRPIKGREAMDLGLANQLAPEGKLLETTLALAKHLSQQPTLALGQQKALNFEFFFSDLAQYTQREAAFMVADQKTADHAEAVNAFLEKRQPTFKGH